MNPDDPDEWRDEAEDEETTDNERDDHEGVPVVDTTGDAGDAMMLARQLNRQGAGSGA
jgi:hypothetical protein